MKTHTPSSLDGFIATPDDGTDSGTESGAANTPDEEKPTLDKWARVQAEVPWLRPRQMRE